MEDASVLRGKGNESFQEGRLKPAAHFYTRALMCPAIRPMDRKACLSNRAEFFLRLEQWEDAESDCRDVLILEHGHVKAKFRLAKALLHTGLSAMATAHIDELLVSDANNKLFQALKHFSERLVLDARLARDPAESCISTRESESRFST